MSRSGKPGRELWSLAGRAQRLEGVMGVREGGVSAK